MHQAYIPSPTQNVWEIGPVPIRAYALCIIAGIAAAIWISERRWVARGGRPGTVTDVAVWAVVFGLVGGRLYHVFTTPERYFGEDDDPIDVVKVWEGGLGIWGAIALGAVGAWIACRRRGVRLAPLADAAAPGIVVGQAIGRLGNWFNNELYGKATDLPWGLTIYNINDDTHKAVEVAGEPAVVGHFHPTFLYELLWNLAVAVLVIWADRKFRLGRGRAFALYVMGYTAGRAWIETLRTDPTHEFLDLRLNVWTSIVVFVAGLLWFVLRRGPREEVVEPAATTGSDDDTDGTEGSAQAEPSSERDETTDTASTGDGEDSAGGDAPDGTGGEREDAGERDQPVGGQGSSSHEKQG